jgi:nitrate reductase (NAD(P)H)
VFSQFHHPVEAGFASGGWMTTDFTSLSRAGGGDLNAQPIQAARALPAPLPMYTTEEVSKHNTREDLWVAMDGLVYDLTAYVRDHPGGAAPLCVYAGGDATRAFRSVHGHDAYEHRESFCIGMLVEAMPAVEEKPALDPHQWLDFTVTSKQEDGKDQIRLTLKAPSAPTGLPVGAHLLLQAAVDGEEVARSYTPVAPVGEKEQRSGIVELLVKVYPATKDKPHAGKMSTYLNTLNKGDTIKVGLFVVHVRSHKNIRSKVH